MRWKVKLSVDKAKWHKHFAWLPVSVDGQRVWLETVYRKQVVSDLSYNRYSYEYRIEAGEAG